MLIYSNSANGKTAKETHITPIDSIVDYYLATTSEGVVVKAMLVTGFVVDLVVASSYDEAVRVVEDIERAARNDENLIELRFLQLHPG